MGERKQGRQLAQHNLRIGPAENRLALFGSEDVLEHPLDAPLLLLAVRMDVEVHRRGDAGMPGDDARGFDGVFALDAARGEALPHPVELQRPFIAVFICPWFYGRRLVAQYVIIRLQHFYQTPDSLERLDILLWQFAKRYFPKSAFDQSFQAENTPLSCATSATTEGLSMQNALSR